MTLRSKLTIMILGALVLFTAITLWKLDIDKEIGLIFIMGFMGIANQIANSYFHKKDEKKEGE